MIVMMNILKSMVWAHRVGVYMSAHVVKKYTMVCARVSAAILIGLIGAFAFAGCEDTGITDAEAVAEALALLEIGYADGDTIDSVTGNIMLPIIGLHDVDITWTSSDGTVVTTTGAVNRPSLGNGNTQVTLTATVSRGDASETKTFTVTVIALQTDIEAVTDAADNLNIDYTDGDTADSVTQDITLIIPDTDGVTITWDIVCSQRYCYRRHG